MVVRHNLVPRSLESPILNTLVFLWFSKKDYFLVDVNRGGEIQLQINYKDRIIKS